MPILAGIVLILQFTVLYHAFRNRRPYYWFFVIMALPVMGCILYYLIEVMPGSRQERVAHKAVHDIKKALNPDRDLRLKAEELAICGSMENKMQLAEECVSRGMFDDAIRLYESAREGQYVNAPDLVSGLARAHFLNGNFGSARQLLQQVIAEHPKYYPHEVALLSARAAAALGDTGSALREIEVILDRFSGLEARYRYAEILKSLGEKERARAEFDRLIHHAQRFRVSAEEKSWAKLAKQELAAL